MEIVELKNENKNEVIKKAVDALKRGEIVIYPTETCYGVGVDATNSDAVISVLKYKSRPEGKPISIAVCDRDMAAEFVEISDSAENIYKNLLPGPVTVVSKSKKKVVSEIESEDGKLGIRIPDHEIPLEIVKNLGKPITSTSANESGKKTPYSIQDIFDNISDKKKEMISLIIDAGELPHNPPSTVVDTTLMELNIIRAGNIKLTQNMREFSSNSVAETMKIASEEMKSEVDELREKPLVILLDGELGAGKTQFVRGIGDFLKVEGNVNSPTYTYMHEFDFENGKLLHLDLWRIEKFEDFKALELESFIKPGNVISIEWWTKFEKEILEMFKKNNVRIMKVYIENLGEEKRNLAIDKL